MRIVDMVLLLCKNNCTSRQFRFRHEPNDLQSSPIIHKEYNTMPYHAHFDCFSGAAGDMMLAACLDAADSLPKASLSFITSDSNPDSPSQQLLALVTLGLENGMPELKGEFELSSHRVWRSIGRIAARKVDVKSVYDHEAAPVPGGENVKMDHSVS
jgi:hypothetical protein